MRTSDAARRAITLNGLLLVVVAIFGLQATYAQKPPRLDVTFKNLDKKTVKICIYQGAGEFYPLANTCLTLRPGQSEIFDRTKIPYFMVYVFEPALIDKLLCKKQSLDPSRIEILPRGSSGCIKTTPLDLKPKPDPNKLPYVSRSDNMLAVCNLSSQEPLHFAITYATGQTGYFTEGWWRLIKNQCLEINLEDLWYKQGLPVHYRFKTYIYAETEGKLGGAIKKVWEGDDPQFAFCINDDKSKKFGNKHQGGSDGAVLWESDCTAANGKRMVKMWPVTVPKLGDPWKWNF